MLENINNRNLMDSASPRSIPKSVIKNQGPIGPIWGMMYPRRTPLEVTSIWTKNRSIENKITNLVRPFVSRSFAPATLNPMKTVTRSKVPKRQLGYTTIAIINVIKENNFNDGFNFWRILSFWTNPNREGN